MEFKNWCSEFQVQYVDATLVAEHIERADQYHGRKTVANVAKLTSFFTSLLHFMGQQKKFRQYETAFDSMINRKLVLSYDDAIEMKSDTHAAAQKQSYLTVKNRVLHVTTSQLGASRMFTKEQIADWAPTDDPMTEQEIAAMTEGVKIELESESQVISPMVIDAPRKRQAEGQQPGDVPIKQRAVTFDVPQPASSSASLCSTEKAAPTSSKIASAVKSRPDPPPLPRPDPPELPSSVAKAVPPPPKGVSAPAPPPKVDYNVDKFEYFDMAITGLPGHFLHIPRNVEAKQEVRISVPNAMQVVPLVPMLGSEFRDKPGVSFDKVPANTRAVRSLSGLLRGFMSKALNEKTDYHGFAHLDDVKRELLTGKFKQEITSWTVETFMSIAAFDEKDRFELLAAVDINHSMVASKTVPFKIRCVQGHQESFLKDRSPTIGALRVFCTEFHRDKYPKRLIEGLADAPPRIYHRTSSTAAMEIIRHGLIPGGAGTSLSGRKHSYLSPFQVGDKAYKSGVRANQPIEVAFDTELVLRSGVDFTLTTSDAITTAQHIPNSCILWVKDTKANSYIYFITDADKRKIYDQSMYGSKRAKDVFGSAAPASSDQKDDAPAETPGRDSDVTNATTQVRHIQERVPADDETTKPATIDQRKEAANKPTALAETSTKAESRGTIPSGTYVALPESPCPRCQNCFIDGMFSCMACGCIIFSSKRSERSLRVYQQRAEFMRKVSEDAQVRINADSLLNHWRGDDIDDRAFQTWESEQLRKGRQKLVRSMKLGFFNVLHRFRRDNVFATSLANINRDVEDCILYDTYALLRLAGVERTAGQRAIGTGPLDRIHKHDRVHVAKVCYITAPNRLLRDEFRDPYGGNWLVFWHQKLFTLTRFVQALRQASFDEVTMLTFHADHQGLSDFQLKGLDDGQRRAMFQESFDEDLQIAATQHCEAEQHSRRTRKPDAILERIEREREDESFAPPDEAFDHREGPKLPKGQLHQQTRAFSCKAFAFIVQLSHAYIFRKHPDARSHACMIHEKMLQ